MFKIKSAMTILMMVSTSVFALTPFEQSRPVPSRDSLQELLLLLKTQPESQKSFATEGMAMTTESPTEYNPEIKELARGLRYDPNLIFKFVHDHIDYLPMDGSLKGPYMTLMDGFGNSYDQSSLLVASSPSDSE